MALRFCDRKLVTNTNQLAALAEVEGLYLLKLLKAGSPKKQLPTQQHFLLSALNEEHVKGLKTQPK